MKIEIKKKNSGDVMYVHEEELNTLTKTLEKLVKEGLSLSDANLEGADLWGADLRGANLDGADLRGTNLDGANRERAELPLFCKWSYSVSDDKIIIGCKSKTAEEWEKWLASDEEFITRRDDPSFIQIEAIIKACIAYQQVILK